MLPGNENSLYKRNSKGHNDLGRRGEVVVKVASCEKKKKKKNLANDFEKKITCGSTVFSTGHPRQYSLAPAMLVCADRTRRGRFIAVWPQMRYSVCDGYK